MKRIEIKKGDRYGKLTIVHEVDSKRCPSGQIIRMFLCKCDCGNLTTVSLANIRKGNTVSCGCQYKETARKLRGKYPDLYHSKLHGVWNTMKLRCYNPNKDSYCHYGGRGITVCDEWKDDFLCFYNWAITNGYKEGLTLDRIDVNGNYEPTNCRWVTMSIQANNKRTNICLTFNGETLTLSQWSKKLGISSSTIQKRKALGWSDEKILMTPTRKVKLENNYIKKVE